MERLITLDRRDLLKATTGLLSGLVVSGSPLAIIAKGAAWALDLVALSTGEASTLLAVARTICPHDKLDDLAYALVIQAVDADAHRDEPTRRTVKDGIAALGRAFAANPENERVDTLKKIASSEFFQTMRRKTVETLYTSPIAYAHFGYEGEAFSKGGYLFRGFDNLRWLPEVPREDSGAMPVGT